MSEYERFCITIVSLMAAIFCLMTALYGMDHPHTYTPWFWFTCGGVLGFTGVYNSFKLR